MERFIAGRTIHMLATLVFAWVYYNMMALMLLDNGKTLRFTGNTLSLLLVAVLAVAVIGVIIGGASDAKYVREQAQDLLFFGTGGTGASVLVTAFAEKDAGVPGVLGMAVISVLIVFTFVAMTNLAIRRYRQDRIY